MKKTILIIAAILSFGYISAQTQDDELKFFQEQYGTTKKAIVENFIGLQGAQATAFNTLYDQYEADRQALGVARIDLIKKYAVNYATLTDPQISELMDQMITLQQKNDKLLVTYYNKIKKSVGVKPAAQFLQIESYFLSIIRTIVLDEIPFIGELEKPSIKK